VDQDQDPRRNAFFHSWNRMSSSATRASLRPFVWLSLTRSIPWPQMSSRLQPKRPRPLYIQSVYENALKLSVQVTQSQNRHLRGPDFVVIVLHGKESTSGNTK
jgi:hypothetical protein